MTFSKKNFVEAISFFLVTGILSYIFFKSNITLFPSFIHAWTQSDRYALALGFLNNGFDFFHPQTFNLITTNGITQVDFPIHEYVTAVIMKLTGIHEPVVFRCYTLIYGLIGLYFLFMLTRLLGGTFFHGLFVAVFIMTCPVFLYYLDGFLPSVPSFANVFIGYYFFFRYKKTNSQKDFIPAIIFFTLAALARLPFLIFLLAAVSQQMLGYLREKKIHRKEVLLFASGILVVVVYFLYNLHLAHKYGTQFLTYLLPAKSLTDLQEIFSGTIAQWKYGYFTKAHYFALLLLIVLAIFFFIRKKITSENRFVLTQFVIAFLGVLVYFFLMTAQFPEHDYYFIDSFYPVIMLLVVYLITKIQPANVIFKSVFIAASFVFIYFFSVAARSSLVERYTFHEWDRTEITRQNFTGAEHFLDSIGIPKNAKMLVLDAYTTNTPLILMNRKGRTLLWTSKENIDTAMQKDFDFVAMQNCFLVSDVIHFNKEIIPQLEKIGDNGAISIYKKQKNENRSLEDFLGVKEKDILYNCQIGFENDSIPGFFNSSKRSMEKHFEGNYSYAVDTGEEYNPTIHLLKNEIHFGKSTKVFISMMVQKDNPSKDADIVLSLNHGDETYFYRSFSVNQYVGNKEGWKEIMLQFVLPEIKGNDDKLSLYLWNKEKNKYFLDNFRLTVYN